VNLIVERAQQIVEDVAHARSRRAFLAALDHFERMLALAPDYPRTYLNEADGRALAALADTVIAHIENRLDHHTDRASLQRTLAAKVYQIRGDIENIYTSVRDSAVQAGC
jgi:hypothetical protein